MPALIQYRRRHLMPSHRRKALHADDDQLQAEEPFQSAANVPRASAVEISRERGDLSGQAVGGDGGAQLQEHRPHFGIGRYRELPIKTSQMFLPIGIGWYAARCATMPCASSPDGICFDAEGAIWYDDVPNACCRRIREGGETADAVSLDRGAFAFMLGGPERCTLYITAAQWFWDGPNGR
jgi:hypothetical protein